MSIEITKNNDTLIVRIYGEFDLRAAEFNRSDIDEKFRSQKAKNIIFNLSKVTFMDSSGLGIILGRYRKVTEQGGKVAMSNVPTKFNKILELSGVKRLLSVYNNETEALNNLAINKKAGEGCE